MLYNFVLYTVFFAKQITVLLSIYLIRYILFMVHAMWVPGSWLFNTRLKREELMLEPGAIKA
jgi:hypothetical protein